jgi:3-phosphoshikimate 1-carboxyvinyltransferase
MITASIHPSVVNGTIVMHGSKSITQRALALAFLHKGTTAISNPGDSDDSIMAMKIIQSFGASITVDANGTILIQSSGEIKSPTTIDCGESALSARIFSSVAALSNFPVIVRGQKSILNRKMNFFADVFPQLNVQFTSQEGYLPFEIKGSMLPSNIAINGAESSQYLTGLLMAFAKAASIDLSIFVQELNSKPYIELTLSLLNQFGYKVTHDNYSVFHISPSFEINERIKYSVEADWSNASIMAVAGAIAGSVTLNGLNIDSLQGDKIILDVLKKCGANIKIEHDAITISKSEALAAFNFDATDFPDLFPPLAVLAACCIGRSSIAGVSRLYNKESNRAVAICNMLTSIGINCEISGDILFIDGGRIKGGLVDSFGDHRIAMAAGIAGLQSFQGVQIANAEVVKKSYPAFFDVLLSIGASVSLSTE